MPQGIKKEHLPQKLCIVCMRPFTWRKKWAKVWEQVKYCSKKCQKNKDVLHSIDMDRLNEYNKF